jgi:hypothetical protein
MAMSKTRFLFLAGIILAAAVSRLLPHPPNFAPIAAMALFGGACFREKTWRFGVPMLAMILSDIAIDLQLIDLHWYMPVGYSTLSSAWGWEKLFEKILIYSAFALSVGLGSWLQRRRTLAPIAGATLASSLLFFIVTNFGAWVVDAYPRTLWGLKECYEAGLPFWRDGTLLGDVFYATVLFGGLALAERWVPATRETVALQSA